jgi:hypothetical protein
MQINLPVSPLPQIARQQSFLGRRTPPATDRQQHNSYCPSALLADQSKLYFSVAVSRRNSPEET